MALLSGLYNIAHRFLGRGPRKDSLDRLPNEVLLDILSLLDVIDIIRLRRVSKLYNQLTQDGALWKKQLRCADIPLPMLPPTSQHTIDRMSGLEAERVLVRALSLARNWRSPHPKVLREWAFDTGEYRIQEMAVLPGGNHLVTAVSDRGERNYSVIVWDMDVRGRPKMVAALATASKAYDIQAKYMTVDGAKSIVLAFLQRDYLHKRDREAADHGRIQRAAHLSTYHKIDAQFRYECFVTHLPLENLQRYVDIPYPYDSPQYRAEMVKLPKAFLYMAKITTRQVLSCPVIGELYGAPHLLVVKGAENIVVKQLAGGEGREAVTLTCMDSPDFAQSPHAIRAIRLLPQEQSVFVVREVETPRPGQSRHPTYLFEVYAAPRCGHETKNQQHFPQRKLVEDSGRLGELTHIYVPEFPPYIRSQDLLGDPPTSTKSGAPTPSVRTRSEPDPPPPICIYAHRSNPEGLIRITFHARRYQLHLPPSPITPGTHPSAGPPGSLFAPTQVVYRHTLQSSRMVFQRVSDPDDVVRIIPGATRPLVSLATWDDLSAAPLVGEVRPFVDRGWDAPPGLDAAGRFVVHPQPGCAVGSPCFAGPDGGPAGLDKRVVAFAWEESIGRLFVAEEGVHALTVVEFAAAPRHDTQRRIRPQDKPAVDADVLMALAAESLALSSGGRMVSNRRRTRPVASSSRRGARGSYAAACR